MLLFFRAFSQDLELDKDLCHSWATEKKMMGEGREGKVL